MRAEPAAILDINGRPVPLRLRRNAQARRILLRLDKQGDGVVVTLPQWVPEAEGVAWAEKQSAWIADCLFALPKRKLFYDGAVIPLEGEDHVIRQILSARRGVWREFGEICVSGQPEHLARRVRDWLKEEARVRLKEQATHASKRLGLKHGRVTVRDTRSQWGSCASNGNLSFSWRLILAPSFVLNYVVAHEVAHLKEPHHGASFWETVVMLDPNMDAGRKWLRKYGKTLHFIG